MSIDAVIVAWFTNILYDVSSNFVASALLTFTLSTLLFPDFTFTFNLYSYSVPSAEVNLIGTSKSSPSTIFDTFIVDSPTVAVAPFIPTLVVLSTAFA